ncbi:hypothetical protein COCSUDRAFT_56804 [Coccomyxa subellipsoidea C-169]|uniref:SAM domain-containing protein n=1 Tax=Coccomyxa subellipsoidea (strain C-169) TaxID=574566 RepID=I0YT75_COCSC|nr:hypothetical protein COCSUDRAFT_56804 [Coccomyxa subellipsoidea C-169]EIE21594.1 hypothetical protein COCSUDRAFT_56804 [Coccomyxa subellipsoidea C-169]|eukprot:XP_005646138.1 hypothetical protein COCSUDRAFT_56804 [Coccomyxa subellipsoidea C-169]
MATESDSMLAEVFHCGQCQLDLSHMEFPQRVAHMKKWRAPLQPLTPAPRTVREWLKALGMGGFADAFEKEEVDMRALPLLSDDDLIYLGATSSAQRKTLLAAAKELTQQPTVTALPQPSSKSTVKKQDALPGAAPGQRMPKAAPGDAADSSKGQPGSAKQQEAAQPEDTIVPDSDEDSDFADDRPAPRRALVRKKAKTSEGPASNGPISGGGRSQPQAPVAEPAIAQPSSIEEERDQLERALALSLSARGETGSHSSQPSSLSSSDRVGAAQPASSMQPPGYFSGALGRVLAARNSRGRVSQNRSYSRQTEQRLLEALYPPGSDTRAGSRGSSEVSRDERGGAANQAGWSSDEDEDQDNCKRGRAGDGTSLSVGLLSKSSIGRTGVVERVPTERSMWALAGHSGAAAVSAASLQERFAARKAADLAQQAALAALKSECQTRDPSCDAAQVRRFLSSSQEGIPLCCRQHAFGGTAPRNPSGSILTGSCAVS